MSNCERIAQVPQDQWATVSKSLRSLMTNERFAQKVWLIKSRKNFFCMFYIGILFLKNERFAHSLIFGERCERIAQVAHQKWAMWVNCSCRTPKISDHERIPQVAHQKLANEQIARIFEQIAHLLIFRKKRAIRSENGWVNSQPWYFGEIRVRYRTLVDFLALFIWPKIHYVPFLPFWDLYVFVHTWLVTNLSANHGSGSLNFSDLTGTMHDTQFRLCRARQRAKMVVDRVSAAVSVGRSIGWVNVE